MKKLLVVLLALTFVVSMATAAFAVATTSVDGKVELTLTNANQIEGSTDGDIVFDLAKDFGEGVKAGLKLKLTYEAVYGIDGSGWIEITKDWAVIKLDTNFEPNAANELGGKGALTKAPGFQIETKSLLEGLTLTAAVNELALDYAYMVKAVYSVDPLTIGAGYQADSDVYAQDAYAVWASYKVGEALTAGFELTGRTAIDAMAYQAKIGYTAGGLNVSALYFSKTVGYYSEDEDLGVLNLLRSVKDVRVMTENIIDNSGATVVDLGLVDASVAVINASYAITDALSVNAAFEYGIATGWDENNMLIAVGASYKLTDAITAGANYLMLGDFSQVKVTVSDTLVAGVVASLELVSEMETGFDTVNGYTAKITATL